MRKVITGVVLFIFLAALPLFGEVSPSSLFEVISRDKSGGYPMHTLKSSEGLVFDLIEKSPLDAKRLNAVEKIASTISGFSQMTVLRTRMVNNTDSIDCHLTLGTAVSGEKELLEFIPGGITLYYADNLRYDVNIISKNLRVRVQGEFFSEQRLLEVLGRVSARPAEYLQFQDPEYIMSRFNELNQASEKLREDYESLLKETQELQQENNQLKNNLLAVGNKAFFKFATPVDPQVQEKIIQWKSEKPTMTLDEVSSALKEAGFSPKKKEIQLIFLIFFGDFSE